jgi:hypothetical protein
MASGPGAHEDEARVGARAGEVGVLGEEAVAGVDGVDAGLAGHLEDAFGVEVALRRGRGTEQVGLVGGPHVRGVPVDLGVDRDGAHAELAAGADHADGDLATVGHQDGVEHRSTSSSGSVGAQAAVPARQRRAVRPGAY